MAKSKQEAPSKSQEIRAILKKNPKMPAKEVVAALAEKGIEATENLVYFVKGKLKGEKGKKQKKVTASVEKEAETPKAEERQTEGEVNKSKEIRDLLKANPRMKASQVVNTLAVRGIKVLSSQVYYIMGKKKGRKQRQVKGKVAKGTGNSDALTTIRKVKGLAEEVGGLKKLQALVEALGE